jgi:hypothetical protein
VETGPGALPCVLWMRGRKRVLARLPEDVFNRIVAFMMPPAFQLPRNYDILCCYCSKMAVLGECETCINRYV